jgi:hypothetical protein
VYGLDSTGSESGPVAVSYEGCEHLSFHTPRENSSTNDGLMASHGGLPCGIISLIHNTLPHFTESPCVTLSDVQNTS